MARIQIWLTLSLLVRLSVLQDDRSLPSGDEEKNMWKHYFSPRVLLKQRLIKKMERLVL
jgi:hypothetical protein